MNNSESNNTGKMIAAALIGTAVGVALGILFAPRKGINTRGKLLSNVKDMTEDLTDKLKDTVNNLREQAEEMAENGIDEIKSTAKNTIKSFKN